jgi:hypothetical protein
MSILRIRDSQDGSQIVTATMVMMVSCFAGLVRKGSYMDWDFQHGIQWVQASIMPHMRFSSPETASSFLVLMLM